MPDLAALLQLSTEAAWNQTGQDWSRALTLWPDGCFCVQSDGRAVSTTIASIYDRRLAWIGMVLTKREYQGRGFARGLLNHALAYLDSKGVECVKLDATDLGRPVYVKLGFEDERPVSRWLRRGSSPGGRPPKSETWLDPDMLALDRRAFGADRGALLERLAADGDVFSLPGQAFALTRPGRTATHFGPCVAQTRDGAREALMGALRKHGSRDMIWDLADEHDDAVRLAMESGFVRTRKLIRMRRGGKAAGAWSPKIYALAGFEYG
ncbi:MAG: GNAT family N-acetyltransferase [Bryobacteraceae bacterium]|nr:GNAT family N-acetyltransferase [Bryobacteraceae bacterium]